VNCARAACIPPRSPIAPVTQTLQVANLQLDTVTHRAKRRAREYQLLEHLMRHVDRPISRTQLLHAVWSFDFADTSNVVDVYVGYLRHKIDADGEPQLIHTVRSVGYMLRSRLLRSIRFRLTFWFVNILAVAVQRRQRAAHVGISRTPNAHYNPRRCPPSPLTSHPPPPSSTKCASASRSSGGCSSIDN